MIRTEGNMDKVLVAGATGRTGQWVVRRLQHYGIPVRALVGSAEKASVFEGDVEIAVGRIGDRAALDRAVKGMLDGYFRTRFQLPQRGVFSLGG